MPALCRCGSSCSAASPPSGDAAAAAELFDAADLIVTYNGKTFDVPVMETRWAFHRMPAALDEVPHFDMLHPARRCGDRARAPVPPEATKTLAVAG